MASAPDLVALTMTVLDRNGWPLFGTDQQYMYGGTTTFLDEHHPLAVGNFETTLPNLETHRKGLDIKSYDKSGDINVLPVGLIVPSELRYA